MRALRSLVLLAALAFAASALAQTNPGTSPLTGPKGGTNNAFMQFAGPASALKTYTLPNASGTIGVLNAIATWTAAQSFSDGTVVLLGSSSGSSTLKAPATGGGTATLFPGSDTIVGVAATQTLPNKTLTAPVLSSATPTAAGALGFSTFPNYGDGSVNHSLADIDRSQTLTNKTFNCANNTCTVRLASDVTGQLGFGNLPNVSADNVIGNPTGSSTTPTNLALVNCANALTYNTTTHVFGCNATAGTGTVTSAQISAGTGINVATTSGANPCVATCNLTISVNQTVVANSLGSNTTIANGSFTDGPSTAQGTSGGWWASGTVTIGDTVANVGGCKLWDGTTVIDSTNFRQQSTAAAGVPVSLSGFISSPAANIRISCTSNDATATFRFNDSGASKDSTLTVHRIQ